EHPPRRLEPTVLAAPERAGGLERVEVVATDAECLERFLVHRLPAVAAPEHSAVEGEPTGDVLARVLTRQQVPDEAERKPLRLERPDALEPAQMLFGVERNASL